MSNLISYCSKQPDYIVSGFRDNFLTENEKHIVFVRRHSVQFYPDRFFDNDVYEQELEIPIDATIIDAYSFKLSGSIFGSLILVASDCSVIIFSHSGNPDDDVPFRKVVTDATRISNVDSNKENICFAFIDNRLFLSLYPNVLTLLSFGVNLEVNTIYFDHFKPLEMVAIDDKLIGFDITTNTFKSLTLENINEAIKLQSSNYSNYTDEMYVEKDNVECVLIDRENYYVFSGNQIFNDDI